MQAPRGRQLKIHSNIVNVPGDVTYMYIVSMLPQLLCQAGTIKVNLKLKLQHKSSALFSLGEVLVHCRLAPTPQHFVMPQNVIIL